jgi:integrase
MVPTWGNSSLQDLRARPVDLWLQSLALAPKSKVHIRGLVRILWDFAMWRGDVPLQRNPMELVNIQGASKRTRQPRSLTVEEFQQLAKQLEEPMRDISVRLRWIRPPPFRSSPTGQGRQAVGRIRV